MASRLTADDVLDTITKGCQQAAEKKFRDQIKALKKENSRLNRELLREQKKRDPNSELRKKITTREKNVVFREEKIRAAATELADRYDAIGKLSKKSVDQFIRENKSNYNYFNSRCLREVRSWVGKKGKVPTKKKKTSRKKK